MYLERQSFMYITMTKLNECCTYLLIIKIFNNYVSGHEGKETPASRLNKETHFRLLSTKKIIEIFSFDLQKHLNAKVEHASKKGYNSHSIDLNSTLGAIEKCAFYQCCLISAS